MSETSPSQPQPQHQPYVPDHVTLPEFTWPAVLVGAVLGIVFGASSLYLVLKVGMTVSASIPGGRAVDHAVPRLLPRVRRSPGDDPGEQHRPDDRLGRRVDRLRRRRDHAGRDAAGLRDGDHPGDGRLGARRAAGHPDDDPAAPGVHRQAARHAELSRRHRLRRRADRRREGRRHAPRRSSSASASPSSTSSSCSGLRLWKEVVSRPLDWFKGATPALGGQPGAAGRRLHHRHADRLHHGGRRHLAGLRARARHPLLRRGAGEPLYPATASRSRRWTPRRSARPTCSTSAPARWRPAASSACSAPCR